MHQYQKEFVYLHPKQIKKELGTRIAVRRRASFRQAAEAYLQRVRNANLRLFFQFFLKMRKQLRKIKKMAQEKVTRDELREMRVGQTRIFQLMEAKKVTSASVTAQQLKNEEGLEFTVKKDYAAKAVSITRMR